MNLKPLHDQIIVMPIREDITTKAGLVLPDTIDKEKAEKGEVVAVGPGKLLNDGKRAEIGVRIGDKVIFKKYAPEEIKIENKEYYIIKEEDVLAIIE